MRVPFWNKSDSVALRNPERVGVMQQRGEDGGFEEFVEFLLSLASSSATRAVSSATRAVNSAICLACHSISARTSAGNTARTLAEIVGGASMRGTMLPALKCFIRSGTKRPVIERQVPPR